MRNLVSSILVLALHALAAPTTHLRVNQMGFPPTGRSKPVWICSSTDQRGQAWKAIAPNGSVRLSGTLDASLAGVSAQTPFAFHHAIDLAAATDTGVWKVVVPGADTAYVPIRPAPYSFFADQIVRYLGSVRSGRNQVSPFRKPSHRGDTSCVVWTPSGSPTNGAWTASASGRKLDLEGGWYDAGDYIKFTQTTAYTTYFLLRAWETQPSIFGARTASGLPAVLDEAAHGLRWLVKTFPDSETFVIEVGNSDDHNQGDRLPEADKLDGKRPALVALSPGQMGLTAASLALGASLLSGQPQLQALADTCRRKAIDLQRRLKKPDVVRTAYFLRDATNDFYPNASVYDDMALGALELHKLTGDAAYLADAKSWSDSAGTGGWCSWGDLNLVAEARFGTLYSRATSRRTTELRGFQTFSEDGGAPWGVPFQQSWAPFDGYPHVAAEAGRLAIAGDTAFQRLAWDIFDYMAGRNNWGVSFFMSPQIRNGVSRIYSQIYPLSKQYPTGAVAEGPGDRATHQDLATYFDIPADDPLAVFNSSDYVFFDNATDFQTMETTIGVEANTLYMLSVLCRLVADTGSTAGSTSIRDAARPGTLSARLRTTGTGWILRDLSADLGVSRIERVDAAGHRQILASSSDVLSGKLGLARPAGSDGIGWLVLRDRSGRVRGTLPAAAR